MSDHVKFAMKRIELRAPWVEFLQESHDSFLAQIKPDKLEETKLIIHEELEAPIDFSKCSLPRGELIIPCDFSVSTTNWQEMRKV